MTDAEPPLRDESGRFLPGHKPLPGCGRPKGFDFRKVVTDHVGTEGAEGAIRLAYNKLVDLIDKGDTQAIKLLLDRLCTKDGDEADAERLSPDERRALLRQLLGL